jgi:hypothetical protein
LYSLDRIETPTCLLSKQIEGSTPPVRWPSRCLGDGDLATRQTGCAAHYSSKLVALTQRAGNYQTHMRDAAQIKATAEKNQTARLVGIPLGNGTELYPAG